MPIKMYTFPCCSAAPAIASKMMRLLVALAPQNSKANYLSGAQNAYLTLDQKLMDVLKPYIIKIRKRYKKGT
jgi:hypothetical protein